MQQKILFAAILASSATAMPWGPGGRWGTEAPPQQTGDAEFGMWPGIESDWPTGTAEWTGRPAMMTAQPVESAAPDTTCTDEITKAVSSVPTLAPMPTFEPHSSHASAGFSTHLAHNTSTSVAGKNQIGWPSPSPASSSTVTTEVFVKPTQAATSEPAATSKAAASKAAASKAAPTSAAAKPSSTGTASTGNAYSDMVVAHHNIHRANHSAPDVAWDAGLASTAQKIAATCNFAHSMNIDGGNYGQNIQAGASADNVWQAITESFYNGEVNAFANNYGVANPTNDFENWGHFSQLVWKSTTQVGCATVHCPNGVTNGVGTKDFTVCNYKPPGNYANDYAKNIGKSVGKPTVDKAQVSSSSGGY